MTVTVLFFRGGVKIKPIEGRKTVNNIPADNTINLKEYRHSATYCSCQIMFSHGLWTLSNISLLPNNVFAFKVMKITVYIKKQYAKCQNQVTRVGASTKLTSVVYILYILDMERDHPFSKYFL